MLSMDVFSSDAFKATSLLTAIKSVPFQPMALSQLGIFSDNPIRTESVWIEQRDGVLTLVPTTPRGAPVVERKTELRLARNFRTVRIAKGDTITASELQSIRAFGSETELMQLQAEVARRMSGPVGIMRDIELTWENMRLGAVQGIVTDADGSTLYDWYTELSVTQATEIDFDLDNASPASGIVRTKCAEVLRAMQRAARGAWLPTTEVYGLCGDAFWDNLIAHVEVRTTFQNWSAAAELREPAFWSTFRYGGINFVNYRGTDDGSTVAINTDKCKFFPVNAPGVFQAAWSPAETFEFVNTPGRPLYPLTIPDRERDMQVRIELYSYPLFICTRPLMLQRARRT